MPIVNSSCLLQNKSTKGPKAFKEVMNIFNKIKNWFQSPVDPNEKIPMTFQVNTSNLDRKTKKQIENNSSLKPFTTEMTKKEADDITEAFFKKRFFDTKK